MKSHYHLKFGSMTQCTMGLFPDTQNVDCACAGNARNVFPRRRLQRKPLVSDPGMHHGTCVTHVPWCMSGSLTRGGGENVPGIPGACAPTILRIWQEAHEADHYLKWPCSANVRIFLSRPAEGALLLWTSCLVVQYSTFVKYLKASDVEQHILNADYCFTCHQCG